MLCSPGQHWVTGGLLPLYCPFPPLMLPLSRFFPSAGEMSRPRPSARFASVALTTISNPALHAPLRVPTPAPDALTTIAVSSTQTDARFAYCSKPVDALSAPLDTALSTSVWPVGPDLTVLHNVLACIRCKARTLYPFQVWKASLDKFSLSSCYPSLVFSLQFGFNAGVCSISTSFMPPNSHTVYEHISAFRDIVDIEFNKGHYLGPFSSATVEALIGPFQSSPLSLVPKSSTSPDKFCLVQNLLYPYSLSNTFSTVSLSINASIDSDLFPCTWGTFTAVALLISRLRPGLQMATRDVHEAYRTNPLAPDQWPGTIIRLSENDQFAINLSNCFGLSSAGGVWGLLADAWCDILRTHSIAPISKWVDVYDFFRILLRYLQEYNNRRRLWAQHI